MPSAIISAQRVEARVLVCLTKPVKLNVRFHPVIRILASVSRLLGITWIFQGIVSLTYAPGFIRNLRDTQDSWYGVELGVFVFGVLLEFAFGYLFIAHAIFIAKLVAVDNAKSQFSNSEIAVPPTLIDEQNPED